MIEDLRNAIRLAFDKKKDKHGKIDAAEATYLAWEECDRLVGRALFEAQNDNAKLKNGIQRIMSCVANNVNNNKTWEFMADKEME